MTELRSQIERFDPPNILQSALVSLENLNELKGSKIKMIGLKKPAQLGMNIFALVLNIASVAREIFAAILQLPFAVIKLGVDGVRQITSTPLLNKLSNKLPSFKDCGSSAVRAGAQTLGIFSSVTGIALFWNRGSEININMQTALGNYKSPKKTDDKEKPLPPEIDDEDDLSETDDVENPPVPPTRDFPDGKPPPLPKRQKASLRRLPKPPAEKPQEQPQAQPPPAKPGASKPPTRPPPPPPTAKPMEPIPPKQPVAPLFKPNPTTTSLHPSEDFSLPDISRPSSPGGSEIRSSSYIGSSTTSGASTPSVESHYHGVPTAARRERIAALLEEQQKSQEDKEDLPKPSGKPTKTIQLNVPASGQQSSVPQPTSIPKVVVTQNDEWPTGEEAKKEPQRKPGANTFKISTAGLKELMKQQMLEEQAEEEAQKKAEEDKKKTNASS